MCLREHFKCEQPNCVQNTTPYQEFTNCPAKRKDNNADCDIPKKATVDHYYLYVGKKCEKCKGTDEVTDHLGETKGGRTWRRRSEEHFIACDALFNPLQKPSSYKY